MLMNDGMAPGAFRRARTLDNRRVRLCSIVPRRPYLYYVRIDDYGDLRILFRRRVKLGWLAALDPTAGASGGASAGKP
jgi:hypothetical protein